MRALPLLVFALAAAAADADDATPAKTKPPTLAVLPLRAEGLQLNEANRLNLLLRARSSTRGGYAVQGEDLTNQLVEASQDLGVNCDINAVACGVDLGKLADVDFVLLGRAVKIAAVGNEPAAIGIDVQLVDVKAAIGLRRIIGRVSLDSERQTLELDGASDALFGTAVLPTLTVNVTPDGATVKLDGIAVGSSPVGQVTGLLPGAHVVDVEKKGYLPYPTSFNLAAGDAAALEVALVVDPDAEKKVISPLQKALPFVGAGVGAAVALTGTGLVLFGVQPWLGMESANRQLDELEKNAPARDFPERAAALSDTSAAEGQKWTSYGQPMTVAGSVAIGVGVVAIGVGLTWGLVLMNADPEQL